MKGRSKYFFLLLILPLGLFASYKGLTYINVKAAKEKVRTDLLDPDSAQFRRVESYPEGAICGEVNAKNRLGGYVGYERFIVTPDGRLAIGENSIREQYYLPLIAYAVENMNEVFVDKANNVNKSFWKEYVQHFNELRSKRTDDKSDSELFDENKYSEIMFTQQYFGKKYGEANPEMDRELFKILQSYLIKIYPDLLFAPAENIKTVVCSENG